jgi:hypothetical protein
MTHTHRHTISMAYTHTHCHLFSFLSYSTLFTPSLQNSVTLGSYPNTHTKHIYLYSTHIHVLLSLFINILLSKSHTKHISIYIIYIQKGYIFHKILNPQSFHHIHALTYWFCLLALPWKFLLTTKEVYKYIYIHNRLLSPQGRKTSHSVKQEIIAYSLRDLG